MWVGRCIQLSSGELFGPRCSNSTFFWRAPSGPRCPNSTFVWRAHSGPRYPNSTFVWRAHSGPRISMCQLASGELLRAQTDRSSTNEKENALAEWTRRGRRLPPRSSAAFATTALVTTPKESKTSLVVVERSKIMNHKILLARSVSNLYLHDSQFSVACVRLRCVKKKEDWWQKIGKLISPRGPWGGWPRRGRRTLRRARFGPEESAAVRIRAPGLTASTSFIVKFHL